MKFLLQNRSVVSIPMIQEMLLREASLKVSKPLLSYYLRDELGMSYHKVKQLSVNHNFLINKLKR